MSLRHENSFSFKNGLHLVLEALCSTHYCHWNLNSKRVDKDKGESMQRLVARLTCSRPVVSLSPIKRFRCSLEQRNFPLIA